MAEFTPPGNAEEQKALAEQLIKQLPWPEQVAEVEVRLGPDYQGIPSLWLEVYVRPDLLEVGRQDLQELTRFTHDLQEYLLKNGVTLFAYSTLEQVA